jgi:hypothetical protein
MLDENIVAFIPTVMITNLDKCGVPPHYGAKWCLVIVHRILVCMGWCKSVQSESLDAKGVVTFAMRCIMNYLLYAEPRLQRVCAVIKNNGSDRFIKMDHFKDSLNRYRKMVQSLGFVKVRGFDGKWVGCNTSYLMLREEWINSQQSSGQLTK